jgi:phosphoglycerol transferase
MRSILHRWKSFTPVTSVVLLATCVLIFLIVRNCGLFPSVFDDEWIYSEYSRLASTSHAPVPSYLFFFLFGTTRFFGQGFLEGARIYNAFFFAVALVFIYGVCRLAASHKLSLFIAIASVLGPISTYSAYFMPEAMYFCAFWVLTWFILHNIGKEPRTLGIGTGAILGCMALIKFHAVFLVPGFVVFIFLAWLSKAANLTFRTVLQTLLFALLAFIVVRFAGGYLLAGRTGLHFTGARYGSFTSPSSNSVFSLHLLTSGWHSLVGHLLALSFLLSVPIAATVCTDWKNFASATPTGTVPRLFRLFALSFLPPLLLVTALSTAMFANGSPYDTIARLHLRYYSFIFPLFFIIAVCERKSRPEKGRSLTRIVVAFILGMVGLFAVLAGLKSYTPNIVDSPELSIVYNPHIFFLSGALGIISLLIWSFEQRIGAMLYLFLFLPSAFAGAGQRNFAELDSRRKPNTYDSAGQFARQLLGGQTAKLEIVGSELIGLYETLFNVDNPHAGILGIPPGAPLDLSKIPAGKSWVLIIGDHESPQGRYRISLGAYSLVNYSADTVIDFRDNTWLGILEQMTGLSGAEKFGRWTDGKEMTMRFVSSLPKNFILVLKARAIGPNIELPFKLTIGQQEQSFRLGPSLGEVALKFQTDGTQKLVQMIIPEPISPKQLTNAPDERQLGAALEQISITELK